MYGGTPQDPKHVKVSEKFRNCVPELPGRWMGVPLVGDSSAAFCSRGGGHPEELVPCGAWSREVFGHLCLVARKSPRFLRDGPY